MASALVKAPDVDASNGQQFPLITTIEEARDEDELRRSLVRVEGEAREEACATREISDAIKILKSKYDDTTKNDQPSASASAATPTSADNSTSSIGKGLGLKQKVLRKGKSLLRRKNSKSPVEELPIEGPKIVSVDVPCSLATTPNSESKLPTKNEGSPRASPTWSLQSYTPTEINYNPNDDNNDFDRRTIVNTAAAAVPLLLQNLQESIRNFDLADLGDYAISEYERAMSSNTDLDKLCGDMNAAFNELSGNYDYDDGLEDDDTFGDDTMTVS